MSEKTVFSREENYWGDKEYVLHCPKCDYANLHQGKVEIWNRFKEDSETGLHTIIDGQTLQANNSQVGNPSWRRQGLTIEFEGECGHVSTLTIYQHKGTTFLTMSHTGDWDMFGGGNNE